MLSHLLSTLILAPLSLAALPGVEAGQTVFYHGTVAERSDQAQPAAEAQKSFDLTWFVAAADESGAKLYWLVEERGRGAWPWFERFGQVTLDAQGRPQGATLPAVLYDYGEGESPVGLPLPLVTSEKPLATGAKWALGGEDFEVLREQVERDRAIWQVQVRNNYGVKRTMSVDKAAPLLVSLDERVFMNMGTEYSLSLRLADVERPSAETTAALRETFDGLLALRGKLHIPPRSAAVEWNAEQMAVLAPAVPELEKRAAGGPLARLLTSAARDIKLQGGRASELTELVAKFRGQPLPAFKLETFAGEPFSAADLAGKVTVLHFWEYRDTPLKEPYGQVGYLEFLYQKRKEQGVQVYGVAVDSRLKDEGGERRAAISGARKLKAFMNLTYPLLLDSGDGIKALGDPRVVGATLPLVVVVGKDGRVAQYHAGFYEIDRQDGLKELDAAVEQALK